MARPIPREAPVMSATFPFNRSISDEIPSDPAHLRTDNPDQLGEGFGLTGPKLAQSREWATKLVVIPCHLSPIVVIPRFYCRKQPGFELADYFFPPITYRSEKPLPSWAERLMVW
jgi:hypothetical protein